MKITKRLHLRTIEHESYQGSPNRCDLQPELTGNLIPKTRCSEFWNRQASGRDHERRTEEIPDVCVQKKVFSFIDGFHTGIHDNLRFDRGALRFQHVDD